MKIDPKKVSCTPLVAGYDYPSWYPQFYKDHPENLDKGYGDSVEMIMQYETDPEVMAKFIPEPLMPGADPIVTVQMAWFEKTYVTNGGEYALSCVCLNSRFDGERDHVEGVYPLVMPETNNWPVLMGRDCSGTGKIFADIPFPYTLHNKHTVAEVRCWQYDKGPGSWRRFYGLDLGPLTKCTDAEMKKWEDAINTGSVLVQRVIPDPDFNGVELNYPNHFAFKRKLTECWAADDAKFLLGDLNYNMRLENCLLDAFRQLPVRKVLGAALYHAEVSDDLVAHGKLL